MFFSQLSSNLKRSLKIGAETSSQFLRCQQEHRKIRTHVCFSAKVKLNRIFHTSKGSCCCFDQWISEYITLYMDTLYNYTIFKFDCTMR